MFSILFFNLVSDSPQEERTLLDQDVSSSLSSSRVVCFLFLFLNTFVYLFIYLTHLLNSLSANHDVRINQTLFSFWGFCNMRYR